MFFKKIKVSHLTSGYWLAPKFLNLFSPHNSKAIVKPFVSLEDLIQKNRLLHSEFAFSFNGDHNFYNVNKLYKIRKIDFQFNKQLMNEIEKNGFHYHEIIPNLVLVWDFKAIKTIYSGLAPFYSLEFYENLLAKAKKNILVDNKAYFTWNRNWGFIQINK
ncbi:hypothetical protein NV226_01095 [Mycoplasma iguanae]|uniref:Uncharacterized protein n=1 Tax=Mycoplasma iguanae TaxID=292461 RepID=A0ABY5R9B7_9MOLU|nr:hypothetical protein [Mycoplasma iguanae]UVD81886.1 hypothetical protein NV226_01095 [Mycoplasma iguanae]